MENPAAAESRGIVIIRKAKPMIMAITGMIGMAVMPVVIMPPPVIISIIMSITMTPPQRMRPAR